MADSPDTPVLPERKTILEIADDLDTARAFLAALRMACTAGEISLENRGALGTLALHVEDRLEAVAGALDALRSGGKA